MKKKDREALSLWQERLRRSEEEYSGQYGKMDRREELYLGSRSIEPVVKGSSVTSTPHVRNICAELVEAQVDNNIPQPKVTPLRKEDERLAKIIEDMLKNEIDRLPFERINDMMERTVPIQGGAGLLIEWDSTQVSHDRVGDIAVTMLHPKMIIPQEGAVGNIEDMDYIFLKLPQTKAYIKSRYGVDLTDERESEPEIRSSSDPSEDMVTQYIAYYRNDKGGIGVFSWVNDTVLENLEDYQARRLKYCTRCGAKLSSDEELIPSEPTVDGTVPEPLDRPEPGTCPYCGGKDKESRAEEYEEIYYPIQRSDGSQIPGASYVSYDSGERDEKGVAISYVKAEPTRIPYYKPNIYPLTLQKNISVFGQFLGDSDIDRIETHQNIINRMERKIIEKLCSAGSYLTLPDDASIEVNDRELKVIYPGTPANKAMIDVFSTEADISQDLAYLEQVYEEARQLCGITDSYQGRRDSTATSGVAKEFAASQSAGRLESKRVAKNAAYAELYEAIFKFRLAYADEPRPVVSTDRQGRPSYGQFNRYDFLERDRTGQWYWNDRFLFSCDSSSGLSNNREAMWQETRENLASGAFGDPSQLETLIMFWQKMELLHYPGAGETRASLEQRLTDSRQIQLQQMKVDIAQSAMTNTAPAEDHIQL